MHCIFKFVLTKDAIWYIIQSTRIVMFYVFLNINIQVLYMHCTCCTMNYVNLCLDNDCMIIPPYIQINYILTILQKKKFLKKCKVIQNTPFPKEINETN